jgi:hypothetical protein
MMHSNDKQPGSKINPEFKARLARLDPQEKVRVVVLLGVETTGVARVRRQSASERQEAIEQVRKSAEQVLPHIDEILRRCGGRRLAESPNALGSIPLETNASGIDALIASDHVRAILEDQRLSFQSY